MLLSVGMILPANRPHTKQAASRFQDRIVIPHSLLLLASFAEKHSKEEEKEKNRE
jgi:hypothetical protein